MLMVIPAVLLLSILSSTKEGRAKARAWLRPRVRFLWIVDAALLGVIIWPLF